MRILENEKVELPSEIVPVFGFNHTLKECFNVFFLLIAALIEA